MDTKDCTRQAAARVDAQALQQAVARAVERAQAVRQNFAELDAEQTRQVSGGLAALTTAVIKPVSIVKPPIIYGGMPVSRPALY